MTKLGHDDPSTSEEEKEMSLRDVKILQEDAVDKSGMWIFGYGSLCWNPGFEFEKSMTGFVQGFSRKFWQGNTTHRGTQNKPGRVATLIQDDEGLVWGQAFQVKEKEAFTYLNNRECELGGYMTTISTFYPRQEEKTPKPFPVVLYLATPSNRLWLGDTPLADIADQILDCAGNSGHNVEYLLRLATFVRENIPEAKDDHLFALESLVLSRIRENNLCLDRLMGERRSGKGAQGADADPGPADPDAGPRFRSDFTSTVTSKTLRCVNI